LFLTSLKLLPDIDVRQSAEGSVSHVIHIVEFVFDPVFSLPYARLEVSVFTKYHYEEYPDSMKQSFIFTYTKLIIKVK
jgi:hypothetical protein